MNPWREIDAKLVTAAVRRLFLQANTCLGRDVEEALEDARDREESPLGRHVLSRILENASLARKESLPICQDTGLAVVFVELGQDVHVVGGSLEAALNEGVRSAYVGAMLRCSCVAEPAHARINTGDNTPAIVHMRVVPGDRLRIVALPKGAGAENKSTLTMLEPSRGIRGVIDSVVDTVQRGGASACPPLVVGVGVGGNFEKAALLAKQALLRPLGSTSLVPRLASLESELNCTKVRVCLTTTMSYVRFSLYRSPTE